MSSQRGVQLRDSLPYHSSAVEEKKRDRHHQSASGNGWVHPITIPIPKVRSRGLRFCVPNLNVILTRLGLSSSNNTGFGRPRRKRGPVVFCFACLAVVLTVIACVRGFGLKRGQHQFPETVNTEPPTLVFRRRDLQRIWEWEIASGHYPSKQPIPEMVGFKSTPVNPAVPPAKELPFRGKPRTPGAVVTRAKGAGPKRVYPDIRSQPPNVAYPPRPIPGSVADLDVVMKHCDFSKDKMVKDCLEVLRTGAGLDSGNRHRRGNIDNWKYIYTEQEEGFTPMESLRKVPSLFEDVDSDADVGLVRRRGAQWQSPLGLPPTLVHRPAASLPSPCDPDHPRLFHMFWAGPFTDKPYMALLSFLYTQNTGIHLPSNSPPSATVCRPKFWLWINPGPAASVPNPNAMRDMFAHLKANPWAAPFLHPRFKDVIEFKLWNTTEQLDGTPEWKEDWRALRDSLFNSGGHVIKVKPLKSTSTPSVIVQSSSAGNASFVEEDSTKTDDITDRTGSKSADTIDKLSTVLSDLARFVLCHRFGGIYLDADNILLRDWEELWGWKGAFAYRWSRLPKYNTAVLRMHKRSALGTFMFRTALTNKLDFHPMTVSRYTQDAHLEGLLLRLPDALFDPAWLNTEYYQRDRPPQPYFYEFANFFHTPETGTADPQVSGFDGFFRGSYSYHYHNAWWTPFDPSRNYPDLGPRFIAGERIVRGAAAAAARAVLAAKSKAELTNTYTTTPSGYGYDDDEQEEDDKIIIEDHVLLEEGEGQVESDERRLAWSTVIKRTFEAYLRGEQPNMYGEWINWS